MDQTMITGFDLPWLDWIIYFLCFCFGFILKDVFSMLGRLKIVPFELDGKVETITLNEVIARLWPFGKWSVVFWKGSPVAPVPSKRGPKQLAVSAFLLYRHSSSLACHGIKKEGGFLDGIEYKPRTKNKEVDV